MQSGWRTAAAVQFVRQGLAIVLISCSPLAGLALYGTLASVEASLAQGRLEFLPAVERLLYFFLALLLLVVGVRWLSRPYPEFVRSPDGGYALRPRRMVGYATTSVLATATWVVLALIGFIRDHLLR